MKTKAEQLAFLYQLTDWDRGERARKWSAVVRERRRESVDRALVALYGVPDAGRHIHVRGVTVGLPARGELVRRAVPACPPTPMATDGDD